MNDLSYWPLAMAELEKMKPGASHAKVKETFDLVNELRDYVGLPPNKRSDDIIDSMSELEDVLEAIEC